MIRNATLIAGPTASGKSALALEIAARDGGVVVNADSMQVYSVLRVLTARPGPRETALVPHLLYGHVDPATAYSAGAYLRDMRALVLSGVLGDRKPVFVGGTGLYFRALLDGLSEMPQIPAGLRAHWRRRLAEEGPDRLHGVLAEKDPAVARTLSASDGQRILRALEVLEASGQSIAGWRARAGTPLVDRASATLRLVEVGRDVLAARIDRRFERMIDDGAVGEVEALMRLGLDPALPAAKAIGVREIAAALAGRIAMAEAAERAKAATRQYAKRQMTWFRNQFGPEWTRTTA